MSDKLFDFLAESQQAIEKINLNNEATELDATISQFSDDVGFTAKSIKEHGENLVPESCSLQEDFGAVFSEFLLGSVIKERAFYRIWRIRNANGWKNIVGSDGQKYNSFGELVKDITSNENLGIGRQIIYDRMKLYDQLNWAGYSHAEIIAKVSAKPSLYLRVFNKVIDWDSATKKPIAILLATNDNLTEDEAKAQLKQLVQDVESFPRQTDALAYIDENVLQVPRVDVWLDGDAFVVEYTKTSVDSVGKQYIDEYGTVRFYPDSETPEWVTEILKTKIK